MKSKVILVSLIAILAVFVFAFNLVSAVSWTGGLGITPSTVDVKSFDISVVTAGVGVDAGETIPIQVVFTANENLSDVRIEASISGYRSDISTSTDRFETVSGRTYSKLLSLTLPSDVNPAEDYALTIRIDDKTNSLETDVPLTIQRGSYSLQILDVEVDPSVNAGSTLPVSVVLKNMGSRTLDDNFVVVSIPDLNVQKKAYFSDLTPTDVCNDCNNQDAASGTLYLSIPSDAKPGVYSLQVEAFNSDSDVKTTKNIAIGGSGQISDVLVPLTSQNIAAGGSASYDLIIVNSGNRIASYDIVPESAQNLIVSTSNPIVTVPADSSATVKVNVQAGSVMGTFNFAVDINSQGQSVKRVNLAANVGKTGIASNNVVILTVILAIIFVVLLIVLIVLLTRKPEKVEEFGESYY